MEAPLAACVGLDQVDAGQLVGQALYPFGGDALFLPGAAHFVGQAVVAERADVGHAVTCVVVRCTDFTCKIHRRVERVAAETIGQPRAFALQLDHALADDEDGLLHEDSASIALSALAD